MPTLQLHVNVAPRGIHTVAAANESVVEGNTRGEYQPRQETEMTVIIGQ